MNIEIQTQGKGFGTRVLIDGKPIQKLRRIHLTIDATGLPILTLEGLATDENNRMIIDLPPGCDQADAEAAVYKLWFSGGSVSINGATPGFLVVDE